LDVVEPDSFFLKIKTHTPHTNYQAQLPIRHQWESTWNLPPRREECYRQVNPLLRVIKLKWTLMIVRHFLDLFIA